MQELLEAYRILGLAPGASSKQIKQAYRHLVKRWHPDKCGPEPEKRRESEEKIKQINLAFECLQENPDETRLRLLWEWVQAAQKAEKAAAAKPHPPPDSPHPPAPSTSPPPSGIPDSQINAKQHRGGFHWMPGDAWRNGWSLAGIAICIFAVSFLVLSRFYTGPSRPPNSPQTDWRSNPELNTQSSPAARLATPGPVAAHSSHPRSDPPPNSGTPSSMMNEVVDTVDWSATASTASFPRESSTPHDSPNPNSQSPEHWGAAIAGLVRTNSNLAQSNRVNAAFLTEASVKAAQAQFLLGRRYANGEGLPQDFEEAAKWFRLAAEAGHGEAQKNLGFLYAAGKGVAQDLEEAEKWFRLSAAQGKAEALWAGAIASMVNTGKVDRTKKSDQSTTASD